MVFTTSLVRGNCNCYKYEPKFKKKKEISFDEQIIQTFVKLSTSFYKLHLPAVTITSKSVTVICFFHFQCSVN